MVGGSLGAAAEWVTIILFAEITKRSFTSLSRQEVYVLYYVAAGLIAAETGAFEGLLWNQYLRQSPAAKQFGIANIFPNWWAPPLDSPAILMRSFFHSDWVVPIIVLVFGMVISRLSWFSVAYTLFRVNSDYERLPFPYAPVAAQGATALAETSQGVESWRWRVFSAGAMIGLVFGAIYVAIPAITGALLTEPVQLIPIPMVDFTQVTGNFIPATPLGFTAHLGPIFSGMVMPFWGVMGTFFRHHRGVSCQSHSLRPRLPRAVAARYGRHRHLFHEQCRFLDELRSGSGGGGGVDRHFSTRQELVGRRAARAVARRGRGIRHRAAVTFQYGGPSVSTCWPPAGLSPWPGCSFRKRIASSGSSCSSG